MRKVIWFATIAIAIICFACFPQGQCDSVFVEYCATGDQNCQGHIIDATHWESGPLSGSWLGYGPEQIYLMHFRDAVTGDEISGDIMNIDGFVGAVTNPDTPGNNFAPCAGNLCEYTTNDSSSFFVKNDTCSSEFFRVVVTLDPSSVNVADAGTE
jgi:hypothetical protein